MVRKVTGIVAYYLQILRRDALLIDCEILFIAEEPCLYGT